MSENEFKIGERVVCIDTTRLNHPVLKFGVTYDVTNIDQGDVCIEQKGVTIGWFKEERFKPEPAIPNGCEVKGRTVSGVEVIGFKREYTMATGVREHFEKPEVQAWMRERVKERPGCLFILTGAGYVSARIGTPKNWEHFNDVNGEWLDGVPFDDSINSITCRAERDGRLYADQTGKPLGPKQIDSEFEEVSLGGVKSPGLVDIGMKSPAGWKIHTYRTEEELVAECGSIWKAYAKSLLPATVMKRVPGTITSEEALKLADACDEAIRKRFEDALLADVGPVVCVPRDAEIHLLEPIHANGCAFCGDAFSDDPNHDPRVPHPAALGSMVRPVHQSCAAQIERKMAAEKEAHPMRVVPDPYAEHARRLKEKAYLENDAAVSRMMSVRNAAREPVRFTADTPPNPKPAGEHPWSNGFSSPTWEE